LDNDDETERNENQAQVHEQHKTADSLGIGTEGVGCRHGLNHKTTLARCLSLHCRNFGRSQAAAIGVVTRSSTVVAVARSPAVTETM
jgi:hypothetical protein